LSGAPCADQDVARRVLGGLLVGALAGPRMGSTSAEEDSGTVIADAGGGDHNSATAVDPYPKRADHDLEHEDQDEEQDKQKDKDKNAKCPATCPLCQTYDAASGQYVEIACPTGTVCCPSGSRGAGQCGLPDNTTGCEDSDVECCNSCEDAGQGGTCLPIV
jgi:hypothetical protein